MSNRADGDADQGPTDDGDAGADRGSDREFRQGAEPVVVAVLATPTRSQLRRCKTSRAALRCRRSSRSRRSAPAGPGSGVVHRRSPRRSRPRRSAPSLRRSRRPAPPAGSGTERLRRGAREDDSGSPIPSSREVRGDRDGRRESHLRGVTEEQEPQRDLRQVMHGRVFDVDTDDPPTRFARKNPPPERPADPSARRGQPLRQDCPAENHERHREQRGFIHLQES